MKIKIVTTANLEIESVQKVLVVAHKIANTLEGQYGTRVITIDSATAIIKVVDTEATILILVENNPLFLFKPRDLADITYNADSQKIAYLYTDSDGKLTTTTTLQSEPLLPLLSEFISTIEYGNIDWKGNEDADGITKILSWWGPPGRLIPVNSTTYIDGLSVPDISFGETDFYTVFRNKIYEQGTSKVVPTVGDVTPKVLGCAYQNTTLVCIVNNHYHEKTGFFEEVWINNGDNALVNLNANTESDKHLNGWLKIHSRETGRPTSIWAFNKSGTKATQGVSEYAIDVLNKAATYIAGTNTFLEVEYQKDAEGHRTKYKGSTTIFSDYKGDTRVFATVGAAGGRTYTANSTTAGRSGSAPIYIPGTKPPITFYVDGPSSISVGATYSLKGTDPCCFEGDVTWSFSGGTISSSGYNCTILSINTCGMVSVNATICGNTYTLLVRSNYNSGWVLTSTSGAYSGSNPAKEYISGNTRIVEYGDCACGIVANTQYVGEWLNGVGCCVKQIVISYSLYGPAMYPIGATQIASADVECLSQQISCGTGATNSIQYQACTGAPIQQGFGCNVNGTPGILTTHTWLDPTGYAKWSPQKREVYEWRCLI